MRHQQIALFGAAGKTGRAVTAALARRGVPEERIRRLVRPGRAGPTGPGERAADLTDPASVTAALDGVDVVHVLAPNLHPGERRIVEIARDAALDQGVRRLVYHSVLRPGLRAMPHHWAKLEAEELLWASDLEVTVLQPSAYTQNLAACLEDGAIVVPYSVDVPFSLVDLEDVAEVTARVLTEPGLHGGAGYELAGPVVTVRELAGRLGLAARRRPPATPAGDPAAGDPGQEYPRRALAGMFAWYDRHGLAGNPRVLEHLLGRPARPPQVVLAAGR